MSSFEVYGFGVSGLGFRVQGLEFRFRAMITLRTCGHLGMLGVYFSRSWLRAGPVSRTTGLTGGALYESFSGK